MAAKIPLDPYVLDALMRDLVGHDRRPSAYLVYIALIGLTAEGRTGESHQALAWRTGLSKRSVQAAIAHLIERGLLRAERRAATEAAILTPLQPWRRDPTG